MKKIFLILSILFCVIFAKAQSKDSLLSDGNTYTLIKRDTSFLKSDYSISLKKAKSDSLAGASYSTDTAIINKKKACLIYYNVKNIPTK